MHLVQCRRAARSGPVGGVVYKAISRACHFSDREYTYGAGRAHRGVEPCSVQAFGRDTGGRIQLEAIKVHFRIVVRSVVMVSLRASADARLKDVRRAKHSTLTTHI